MKWFILGMCWLDVATNFICHGMMTEPRLRSIALHAASATSSGVTTGTMRATSDSFSSEPGLLAK